MRRVSSQLKEGVLFLLDLSSPITLFYIRLFYAFLVAFGVAVLITPLAGRFARRIGLIDHPGDRKVHTMPIPYGGGIGIFLGFLAAVLLLGPRAKDMAVVLGGAFFIVLLGVADDRWQLRPLHKLAGQVAIATAVAIWGPRVEWVTNPFGSGMLYLGWWGVPITVLWTVAVVNMVNLIDGLDGLAAGVASISCIPLFVVAMQQRQDVAVFLTVALMGSAMGFLRYNFAPARLFMGDAGSMLLGFILATVAVTGALKGAAAIALAVPVVALGVPVIDTACAIVRRWQKGHPISQADKGHLHHRLLAMGLSQRQVVLVIYGASALLGIGAIILSKASFAFGTAVLSVLIVGVFVTVHRIGLVDLRHGLRRPEPPHSDAATGRAPRVRG